jgi:hypothetical protein
MKISAVSVVYLPVASPSAPPYHSGGRCSRARLMPFPTAGQALRALSSVSVPSVLLSRGADGGQRRAAKQARSGSADRNSGNGSRLRRDAHPPGNPTDQRGRRAERLFIFAQNIIAGKLEGLITDRPGPQRSSSKMSPRSKCWRSLASTWRMTIASIGRRPPIPASFEAASHGDPAGRGFWVTASHARMARPSAPVPASIPHSER